MIRPTTQVRGRRYSGIVSTIQGAVKPPFKGLERNIDNRLSRDDDVVHSWLQCCLVDSMAQSALCPIAFDCITDRLGNNETEPDVILNAGGLDQNDTSDWFPVALLQNPTEISGGSKRFDGQTVRRLRPFVRRDLITLRPARLCILLRKP